MQLLSDKTYEVNVAFQEWIKNFETRTGDQNFHTGEEFISDFDYLKCLVICNTYYFQ